jgi:hypothetical protein
MIHFVFLNKNAKSLLIGTIILLIFGCSGIQGIPSDNQNLIPTMSTSAQFPEITSTLNMQIKTTSVAVNQLSLTSSPTPKKEMEEKMDLWLTGAHLRGANIYQRRRYPEIDGPEDENLLVIPSFTQTDFDDLAKLGANLVIISHPGIFTEEPPYTPDIGMQNNLDELLRMIKAADLFAVIGFRTGPGRSEFSFFWGEHGDWFDTSYYNNKVWTDVEAQEAWAAMWRYTALWYSSNPIVVGYELMVEPNSNHIFFDEWDQETFYDRYAGTLYDWNLLAARITNEIRLYDTNTPILIGGNSYSNISWLPYIVPTGDLKTIYTVDQYAPYEYTSQSIENEQFITYPGYLDIDDDGRDEVFDLNWFDEINTLLGSFTDLNNVPVAITEFGIQRWIPGAAEFMDDQIALFEDLGINHAIWAWSDGRLDPTKHDAYDFRLGPDPDNHMEFVESDLFSVIRSYWGLNKWRPSNVPFAIP